MVLPLSAQKKVKKAVEPFDRGIELPNSCFIPKGTVGGGLSISYSKYNLGNAGADDAGYQMLFSLLQGINGNMESFGVAPFVSYFVSDNLSVGLRFGYDRTGAYLGNADVIFGGEEPLLNLENVGYLKQNYSGAATLRNYIPFPNTKRFAMFTEIQLGGGYAQSESYRYALDQESQETDKFGSDEQIAALFHNEKLILGTLEKDLNKTEEEGLIELNRKLRPGEVPNVDSIRNYVRGLMFDRKKYDLSRVGRYKFNKKLALRARIAGQVAYEDIIDADGVVHAKAGEVIDEPTAFRIQNAGINEVKLSSELHPEGCVVVTGNNHVEINDYITVEPKSLGINEMVHYPALKKLIEEANGDSELLNKLVAENVDNLIIKHILIDDIISTINYIVGLRYEIGYCDNIDHLGNRRVRSVGELLQNQFRIGISRLERVIRERMQIQSDSTWTPL